MHHVIAVPAITTELRCALALAYAFVTAHSIKESPVALPTSSNHAQTLTITQDDDKPEIAHPSLITPAFLSSTSFMHDILAHQYDFLNIACQASSSRTSIELPHDSASTEKVRDTARDFWSEATQGDYGLVLDTTFTTVKPWMGITFPFSKTEAPSITWSVSAPVTRTLDRALQARYAELAQQKKAGENALYQAATVILEVAQFALAAIEYTRFTEARVHEILLHKRYVGRLSQSNYYADVRAFQAIMDAVRILVQSYRRTHVLLPSYRDTYGATLRLSEIIKNRFRILDIELDEPFDPELHHTLSYINERYFDSSGQIYEPQEDTSVEQTIAWFVHSILPDDLARETILADPKTPRSFMVAFQDEHDNFEDLGNAHDFFFGGIPKVGQAFINIFKATPPSRAAVHNNAFNQDLLKLIGLCENYDFQQAQVIVQQYNNHDLMHKIYAEEVAAFRSTFTPEGIRKNCLHDPSVKIALKQDIATLQAHPAQLRAFNDNLLKRRQLRKLLKDQLFLKDSLEKDYSKANRFLYALVDHLTLPSKNTQKALQQYFDTKTGELRLESIHLGTIKKLEVLGIPKSLQGPVQAPSPFLLPIGQFFNLQTERYAGTEPLVSQLLYKALKEKLTNPFVVVPKSAELQFIELIEHALRVVTPDTHKKAFSHLLSTMLKDLNKTTTQKKLTSSLKTSIDILKGKLANTCSTREEYQKLSDFIKHYESTYIPATFHFAAEGEAEVERPKPTPPAEVPGDEEKPVAPPKAKGFPPTDGEQKLFKEYYDRLKKYFKTKVNKATKLSEKIKEMTDCKEIKEIDVGHILQATFGENRKASGGHSNSLIPKMVGDVIKKWTNGTYKA